MNAFDAIVFDFDGVLVESVDVKGEAFAALYESQGPAFQQKIRDYHRHHGGVSRYDKIRHFEQVFLGRAPTEEDIESLAQKFSQCVEDQVVACPDVIGAPEFLKAHHISTPLFVNSATPEEELRRIVARRGMERYFRGVYGSPVSKADNLRRVMSDTGFAPARIVMIGDTLSDYRAAIETGARFIGRVPPGHVSPFPEKTLIVQDLGGLAAALAIDI